MAGLTVIASRTRWLVLAVLVTSAISSAAPAETIKVGILHSLSGTMAINETSLKDVILMMIEDQNKKGGVLGMQLEPVVVDPASNWPRFAEKARELIERHKVAVVFGCWTSISRKSVLPVFEELNGLLFYPVQYEGEESSPNVFYTGAVPNQQAIPAVEYLMSEAGGRTKRWVLLGTDFVYPNHTNKILRAFLHSKGVQDVNILEGYTGFGHSDYQTIVANIKKFAAGGPTAVVSTINGDSNVSFYKELGAQGIQAEDIPVVALSVGEDELRGMDTSALVGHLAAWNYFMSIDNDINREFVEQWKAFVKRHRLPGGIRRTVNDPMEAHYIGFKMWVRAVEQAGTTHVDLVRNALAGQQIAAPSGYAVSMDNWNHHLHKPAFIGRIRKDGQVDVVSRTTDTIRPVSWNLIAPHSYHATGPPRASPTFALQQVSKSVPTRSSQPAPREPLPSRTIVQLDKTAPVIAAPERTEADEQTGTATIRGTVRDESEIASLTINGQEVEVQSWGGFEYPRYLQPGEEEHFELVAIDRYGNRSVQQVTATRKKQRVVEAVRFERLDPNRSKPARRERPAAALVIGVQDYKRMPDALYASSDASVFEDYARQALGVPRGRIVSLLDADADNIGVQDGVRRLGGIVDAKTDLYVYFAGHGFASGQGTPYLLPHDGDARYLNQLVSRNDLFESLARLGAGSVTVFLDTCYSGRGRSGTVLAKGMRPLVIASSNEGVPEGFTVISAAAADEFSGDLPEAEHGLFSYFLMRGLEGEADRDGDRAISVEELHGYVAGEVRKQAARLGREQTPEIFGERDRVLVRY